MWDDSDRIRSLLMRIEETKRTDPTKYAEDIPRDLDDLVISMLSLDPMGRPSSAADVIERLTAIAGLEARATTEVVESYLLSSPLRGRDQVLGSLEQRLIRGKETEQTGDAVANSILR